MWVGLIKNIIIMNRKTLNIIIAFFTVVFIITACEKEDPVKLPAQMDTWGVRNVTSTSAELSGIVVAEGAGYNEYGVCWSTSETPTVDDSKESVTDPKGSVYWITATGLENLTKYYSRAYAIGTDGAVTYGADTSFTTLANEATITIDDITNITSSSALSGGNVPYDGKSNVTAKGLVWSMSANPVVDGEGVTTTIDGDSIGAFITNLTDLVGGTMYYVRAYATNGIGTAYSDELSFTTLVGTPIVSTDSVVDITKVSATVHGNVPYTGGADITERGFSWGTASDALDTDIVDGETVTGTLSAMLSGLEAGVTYFIAAYAENSEGRAYGDTLEFQTTPNIIVWYVPGSYVANSYPEGDYSNWTPESSPFVRNTLAVGDQLEGYVNMADASNEWKFATDNTWATNFGDDGADGTLEAGGANIVSSTGYYKINVDMATNPMTYTAVSTDWGVIGSATPGGWDSDTDLTYDPASQTWRGAMHLTAGGGEIKFRANDGWDINYGLNDGDEFLSEGGSNIAIDVEADYDITLDLSNPNEYTYMANRWGLIGDATPGGWDTDTDMTWDAGNSEFTVTLDLTVGEFKFRANDDWAVNLGGDINGLTQDGANIAVGTAGNYTITLNTMTMVATITAN